MPECGRCDGRLVWEPSEQSIDLRWSLGAWKCINCGEWFDSETFRNRQRQRAALKKASK